MEQIETITAKKEIENFVLSLKLDKWKLKELPDQAEETSSFRLAQEATIMYDQSGSDGTLYGICGVIHTGTGLCDFL